MTRGVDARALAALSREVAAEAAALVREHAARGVEVAATKSSDVDVVTAADRASEELLRARLTAARPDDAILGEEGEDRPGTSGVRWVLDPIDGTVNFLYGLPRHAVSVAAQVQDDAAPDGWSTVAGTVLEVPTGSTWSAHLEDGRPVGTRDGAPVRVRAPQPLSLMLVATGFSYDRDVRRAQAESLVRLLPQVRDIRRLGSCALDLCLLGSGHLDGYVEEGVNLWDHAAAALIARAGGARWGLLAGASGRDLLVAAPEASYDTFLEAVLEAGYARSGDTSPRGE
ncbi:inositol monophosphatase family protein [Nocardioides marinus]|uniref:inositol-phosphate phosphatase n=1 Tax=Nocardioides marinus TaxID=374514 RepID=A0A7Z0C4G7_9ACTN|nr:inositol monophosphatase family protein [Nocardioides marinus]NYI10046.1 myo-inositol-1(or 4)-monophosphatase [Nocardioides marinus]